MADIRRLVERSVKVAFDKAGALAESVILHPRSNSGFDFNSMTAVVNEQQSITLKAIRSAVDKQRGERGRNKMDSTDDTLTSKLKLLIQSKDAPELSEYATVEVGGILWNIVHPVSDDGFLITVNLSREA